MSVPSEHLKRLSVLLDQALELPEVEREAWLASLQGDALALAPGTGSPAAKHLAHRQMAVSR